MIIRFYRSILYKLVVEKNMQSITIALAIYELENELERELTYRGIKFHKRDRLYFLETNYCPLFAQVTWIECQKIPITSIGDGIKKLHALGRNWSLFTIDNHRRAKLIQDGLYKIKDDSCSLWPHLQNILWVDGRCWMQTPLRVQQTQHRVIHWEKLNLIENKEVPPSVRI